MKFPSFLLHQRSHNGETSSVHSHCVWLIAHNCNKVVPSGGVSSLFNDITACCCCWSLLGAASLPRNSLSIHALLSARWCFTIWADIFCRVNFENIVSFLPTRTHTSTAVMQRMFPVSIIFFSKTLASFLLILIVQNMFVFFLKFERCFWTRNDTQRRWRHRFLGDNSA